MKNRVQAIARAVDMARSVVRFFTVIFIFGLFAMPSSVKSQDITYEEIFFVEEAYGSSENPWVSLRFRIEGFRIDGECYVNCMFAFTLDSALGEFSDRSDIGIRPFSYMLGGATVFSDMPFEDDQVFIGRSEIPDPVQRALDSLTDRERYAIAWIAANSKELIEYALKFDVSNQSFWELRANNFEAYVLEGLRRQRVGADAQRLSRMENSYEDLIKTIQPALAQMGLYTAGIDGLWGPGTERAVRAFQRANDRLETGYIDAGELGILKSYLRWPDFFVARFNDDGSVPAAADWSGGVIDWKASENLDSEGFANVIFDADVAEFRFSITQIASTRIPNRTSGEAFGVLDLNNDMVDDIVWFEASTRDGTLPLDNDAPVLFGTQDGQFEPDFKIEMKGDWPATISLNSLNIKNGPISASWTQDVIVADFNGDSSADMMFSGHGREYPEGFEGEFEDLISDPDFWSSYPGDRVQLLLSGEVLEVRQVTTRREFWHSARAGDLDGDGDYDIVATNFDETLIFDNDGAANFQPIDGPGELNNHKRNDYFKSAVVEVVDLDGDGVSELIVGPQQYSYFGHSNHPRGLRVYSLSPESGDWSVVSDIPFPTFSSHVGIEVNNSDFISVDKINSGDFDGDGDSDLIVKFMNFSANFSQMAQAKLGVEGWNYFGTVVFENVDGRRYEEIHFEPYGYSHPGNGAEFVDINSDGLLDIVSPGWPGMHNDISDVFDFTFINVGSGTFKQLSQVAEIELTVQPSRINEIVGENFSVQDWGIDVINGKPNLVVNKYGPWLGENDLLFLEIESR